MSASRRSGSVGVLGLVLGLLALPAAGAPPATSRARPRVVATPKASTSGEVRYLTSTLAYLNRGRDDGVKVGMTINFTRGGRAIGTCAVDAAADRWATCLAGPLHKGDRFSMARKPEAAPPGPSLEVLTERDVAARHDLVMAADTGLVEFDGDSGGPQAHRVSVALGQTTYANFSGEGPFQVQRLDVAVYDVDLWKGLRVSADLSVLNFSQRPSNFQSKFVNTPVLLVRQLELGFRRSDVAFSGAIGLVWTRWVPGLSVVDGLQASYRVGDWLETGVYGGLLPNAYNIAPSTQQWSAGAFVMARVQTGEGATSTLFQTEGRLGYSLRDQLGGRFELAAAAHLYQGKRVDAHALLELAYGGEVQSTAGVDGFRIDVGYRPVEQLRVFATARYRGGSVSGAVDLGMASPLQKAIHADGGVTWEVAQWLWLGGIAGVASDFVDPAAGLTQGRFGPEVTFPNIFGRGSALMVGYDEELGWLPGRSAYVQTSFTLFGRARILSRTSWLQQMGGGLASNDIAETFNVEVSIFRWLWVRTSVSGRTQLEQVTGPSRTAGVLNFQVGGQY